MSSQQHDYRYAIDKSTGNLLIIQDSTNSDAGQDTALKTIIPFSSAPSLSGDALALLQVLDDGECVLETSSDQITFHSTEDINANDCEDVSKLNGKSIMAVDINEGQHHRENEGPLRRALWSRRKIADFIQCIHNNEQRFRKCLKIRGSIWNEISKEMFKLGHHDCNKDECSKKWNNLYRTWKKVKLRPKEDRQKWQYYHRITNLVKAISQRDKDNTRKQSQSTTQELILQLMEQNCKHQEKIDAIEEAFQTQVMMLNNERDEILNEIKIILEAS